MSDSGIEPQWLMTGAALVLLSTGGYMAYGAYQRRSRRKGLLARLERIAYQAVHQVLVPDGMGGFIHIDHLLLTPRGVLVLDTRRVAGLIFGGDQMSDWTVMGRGRRFTFDNPQPALYDRIAAVKALVGDVPVEGRLLFSNIGKFTKGKPKYVLMLDGIEVEFPAVDRSGQRSSPELAAYTDAWMRLVAQLRPSPHTFTSL
ncbi:MAG: NERD domain-containing protein [Pseudomonadota bacterium]|nr:NERD domain-containing protein [Pseudomonadota bacterium]